MTYLKDLVAAPEAEEIKAPYETPALQPLGNVREILAASNEGSADDGLDGTFIP